ncbi:MAG: cation:proton antiporter [Chthoniobacter sp.]
MLVYLLNGVIFVFIGLQLPQVMHGLQHRAWANLLLEAGAISLVVIAVRILWIFPSAYLPRFLSPRIRARNPYPDWRHLAIVSWSGMRGVDSLATALALPLITAAGAPFPGRDIIIFVSFAVILVTLVAQGLTLPFLIRILRIGGDEKAWCEEHTARVLANQAALAYLQRLAQSDTEHAEQISLLEAQYHERLAQLETIGEANESQAGVIEAEASRYHQVAREALRVEREKIIDLRNEHRINDETLRVVERDIDLADARLSEREG